MLPSPCRYGEAIELLLKSTMEKSREAVRNWPAYLYTLLRKFDPDLYEELRRRLTGPLFRVTWSEKYENVENKDLNDE